jgi:arginase
MVLGNLMGEEDPDFARAVKRPIAPRNIMYAVMDDMSDVEHKTVERLGLSMATPAQLAHSSEPVIDSRNIMGAHHVVIRLDLDVMHPAQFRALIFSNPQSPPGAFAEILTGIIQLVTWFASWPMWPRSLMSWV